jgi:trimeric autotransporter adhesin
MQRFLTFVVLLLLSVPVGLSIQGCANKNSNFCNGQGFGYNNSQPVSISLQPQTTGLSVAFAQTSQLQAPSAQNCKGGSASVGTYTYGTTDRTIADVSPTGAVCGGTWNLHTPAVADYTTCLPTNKTGVAYMTASAEGFSSNQVAVYSHPPLTSISIQGPTTGNNGAPQCLSQGQTRQLDATAYCSSTGTTGACPSQTIAAGQPVLLCAPPPTDGSAATVPDCNTLIGHITYAAASAGVVTIDQNGVATAQAPGSTLVTGTIAQTSSNAGYFYTCPPAKIDLKVASTGAQSANITLNTPLALTATVTDTNNNVINGLALTYVSTNPGSIAVSSTGAVTASFPSNSAITAICQPTTCNQAPINVMGTLGTGVPVLSPLVQIASPGKNSNFIWVSSPGSPYFVPIDLSTGTIGNQIKLPYSPNSMVLDPTGTTLYFGSYKELMTYTAATNSLASEVPNVPGVVLAVSPTNSSVVVNDQLRGVLYLYTPATSSGTGTTATSTGGSYTSFAGIGQKAMFTPDGQTVYIVGNGVLYTHNNFTGWSVETLPANQATPTTGICPATNTTSPIPQDPTSYPPNTTANPNNTYNMFCSPDLAVTIPAAAAFLSGATTSAYGQCPDTTVQPVVNYPEATTVAASSDHVASTTDGQHIIGASANPPVLSDLSITPVPHTTVPLTCPTNANGQTTGITFSPAPVVNQFSLAAYGVNNINEVVAATNSVEAFVTYGSAATTPPAGGALLPVYKPSTTAGSPGTLSSVTLAGKAIAPVAGIFSPDNTLFFAGTSGDNVLHVIDTTTLLDTKQIDPKLTDINGNPLPPVFLAVKPRPTT